MLVELGTRPSAADPSLCVEVAVETLLDSRQCGLEDTRLPAEAADVDRVESVVVPDATEVVEAALRGVNQNAISE